MGIEKEIVENGFNWFAFICALVVFLLTLSLIQENKKGINDTAEKVIAFFIVPSLFGTAIYFLLNSIQ